MVVIRVLIFLVFGFGPLVVFGAKGQGQFEGLSEAEIALVQAIRNHDELALRDLSLRPELFFNGPHLGTEFSEFLWDGDSFRAQHPDWKGLRSISELSEYGYLEAMRAEQPDGSIIVSFVPNPYIEEATTAEFFTDGWLVKFFACRFENTDKGWKIVNLCFAASSGPYPEPYG